MPPSHGDGLMCGCLHKGASNFHPDITTEQEGLHMALLHHAEADLDALFETLLHAEADCLQSCQVFAIRLISRIRCHNANDAAVCVVRAYANVNIQKRMTSNCDILRYHQTQDKRIKA